MLHCGGKSFESLGRSGVKANITTLKPVSKIAFQVRDRAGRIGYTGATSPVEIDEDVREECWIEIRKMPEWKARAQGSL
jgi:hypothetical protein